jgi:hypothetical protein
LKPTATGPLKGRELSARRDTVTPAAVLLRAWFFTRVSRREVYTMSFPPISCREADATQNPAQRHVNTADDPSVVAGLFSASYLLILIFSGVCKYMS